MKITKNHGNVFSLLKYAENLKIYNFPHHCCYLNLAREVSRSWNAFVLHFYFPSNTKHIHNVCHQQFSDSRMRTLKRKISLKGRKGEKNNLLSFLVKWKEQEMILTLLVSFLSNEQWEKNFMKIFHSEFRMSFFTLQNSYVHTLTIIPA